MGISYKILLTLLLCLLNQKVFAEDDVLSLLKELKAQVQELKSQVNKSNERIAELEKERQQYRAEHSHTGDKPKQGALTSPVAENTPTQIPDKPAVTVGDVKGTFKIPGTDTSVGLGGFVKTDVILNSVSAGPDRMGDQQLVLSQIPIGAPGEHSQLVFHAKESRLWFKSYTPGSWGDINTYLEMDLFGDPATYTYTPRLRHAYGSIGNFLTGQTWTTFLNVASLPDSLDVGGSAGAISNLRQPLVRWTQPFLWAGTPMEVQIALEASRSRLWVDNRLDPSSMINANAGNPNIDAYFTNPNAERYPDVVSRINFNPDWGNVSIAALGRQIRYSNNTGFQQAAWAGSLSLAGKINTFGLDNIRFMAHYGNGHGRYLTSPNTFADAALDRNGNLDLVSAFGGMLSYQHWWHKQWRSSVTHGFAEADQPRYVNTVLNRQVQSVHANLQQFRAS